MKVIDLFFLLLARYYKQSGNENTSTDAFPASPNTVLYKKIGVFCVYYEFIYQPMTYCQA